MGVTLLRVLTYLSRAFSRVWLWFSFILIVYVLIISIEHEWIKGQLSDRAGWEGFYAIFPQFLVGFIVSCIFYFLVVFIPERRRRNIFRSNSVKHYERIKRDILSEIISASSNGGMTDLHNDDPTIQKLLTIDGFRDVFLNGCENADEGYYAFLNYINEDVPEFREIVLNLQILKDQIKFILQNYPIADQEVFDFFKALESYLTRFETTGKNDDDQKVLSHLILVIFSGYSFVATRDYDIIEKMIKDI